MKILWVVTLGFCLSAHASAFSQPAKVKLEMRDASLDDVLHELGRQAGVNFLYNFEVIKEKKHVSLKVDGKEFLEVLDELLPPLGLSYVYDTRVVVIREASVRQQQEEFRVSGKVVDARGLPLPGATVRVQGMTRGAVTDKDGAFSLLLPGGAHTLHVSFVGMESRPVAVDAGQQREELKITLKEIPVELEDIVVTGIYTRAKESFTGSAATYSAAELKTMGTRDVLRALKTLDPSFAIIEDNLHGSDPNRLPNMEIRGKSSILGLRDELDTDPNQPLFILDGFESTPGAINDLDINRVASITILKDAASTAIYGSKAANGVVVVETVRPEPGKLQVSYNGNLNLTIPDLSSYNLMNAREKLEFEVLAGRYSAGTSNTTENYNQAQALHALYQAKSRDVASGVNTYWLAEPLRVGANQKHSLYLMGGEGTFLFGLGGSYTGTTGAMKRSFREVISGNIDLIYRVSTFQFSNKFSISSTSLGNPIVSFQQYAEANPYYKKRDDEGIVNKWLEDNDYFRAANPLWNDHLNSRNKGNNLSLGNYFVAEWNPTRAWKLRARFGLAYGNDDTEAFYSREDTRYEDTESLRRGEFFTTNTRRLQQEGEASVTYAKLIGLHRVNFVAGGNLFSSKSLVQGFSVEGFPDGDFTYPSFANGYPENGSPIYHESISRSVNGYFNAGYAFDDRYLADVSLRTSGSSLFGTTRRYNTTWSVGVGWNLHREKWIANLLPRLDLLKLRASIGNPGNQSFDSAQTLLTYAFQYGAVNYFGLGALLDQLGNPDLKWQTTLDRNVGLDVTLLDKRFSLTVDYYYKVTDPLLIRVNMPQSSGSSTYLTNAGEQVSRGWTFSASYYVFRDLERRLTWQLRANGRAQSARIDKIGNQLATFNQNGRGSNTIRYYDGADPDDLWAVRSVGIDPATGRELFLDKEGNFTYDFFYDDEVISGNSRPDLEGVVGTSFTWRGLSLALNFRYQFGADVFNTALYQKVENISVSDMAKNQDKRAFYQRWQKAGDIVPFKNITDANPSPISSRFIQRENVLALESLNVGYEFFEGWIERVGLSNLKFQVSARDLFRASSIRAERGIIYPFARDVEAGLSFNF
ncbi:MAG: SusC/RagA family TonB-linked outer membrane protein [Odoribacteraceae bacterium]|jgi:TonB-linked SusC/RagA family outer membrane protein|nr:SusC/RagA family TonB-linked outer membrane protein [Odoribacteraceae bacterium]